MKIYKCPYCKRLLLEHQIEVSVHQCNYTPDNMTYCEVCEAKTIHLKSDKIIKCVNCQSSKQLKGKE